MKTTRTLDHISEPRVVFLCLLIGHQDLWIKTKQIEHENNTSVKLIIIINQLHCQFIFFLEFSKHSSRTFYNFVFISSFVDEFCEPIV